MIDEIQCAVENELKLERGVLSSSKHGGNGRREEPIMKARWVALILCREFLPTLSASYLSRHFYREHSTALYVLKTFAKRGGYDWEQYKRCRPIVEKLTASREKPHDPYVLSRQEKAIATRDAAVRHLESKLSRANDKIIRLAQDNAVLARQLAELRAGTDASSLAALRAENMRLKANSISSNMAHELEVLRRENRKLRGGK